MTAAFLEPDEVVQLTDCKTKRKQIDALRQMGLPFFVTPTGKPVVARSVIDGMKKKAEAEPKPKWTPRVLQAG